MGSGGFTISVPRTRVLQRIGHITNRVGHSLRKQRPIFLTVLGNSFIFTTSLVHRVGLYSRVSFIGLTSCSNATSAKRIGRVVNLGMSVRKHSIIVIRSVMSSKLAVGCVIRLLRGRGPHAISVYALLLGPSGLGISLSVPCGYFRVPGSFVLNCNLSCSNCNHGAHSVCAMIRWRESIFRGGQLGISCCGRGWE